MDRARFIADNRAILTRIVACLIAMVGLATRVSQPLSREVWRVLYPAEAAVRRLIVIAARGLAAAPAASRPMPKGLTLSRKEGGPLLFQLFDRRRRLSPRRPAFAGGAVPRVHGFGIDPLVPFFQPRPVLDPAPAAEPDAGDRRAASAPPSRGDQNGARKPAASGETSQALAGAARPDATSHFQITAAARAAARPPARARMRKSTSSRSDVTAQAREILSADTS